MQLHKVSVQIITNRHLMGRIRCHLPPRCYNARPATRQHIETTVTKLNQRQHEAVRYIDGPMLVLAGAGSGKTSVITRKIAYLTETCGVPARNITAVTFTNKSAREMQERVSQLISTNPGQGPSISTFHRLGLRIIRAELKTLGLAPGFSIFDTQDSRTLVQDILQDDHGRDQSQTDFILQTISRWKDALLSPAAALTAAQGPADHLCAQVYQRYQHNMEVCNALDFDDLIAMPSQLFTENAAILERWQNRIHYLLVDEYQDTNNCQYQLVRQLVGRSGKLTVVGDDDQSIYTWRGARPENLALLQSDFPGLKIVKLEQNYRSTGRLLQAANQLIANNSHLFDKQLWSNMGPGEPIRVIHCDDEDAEAEQVTAELLDHHLRSRSDLADYAILYRSNHQARLLELKLQANQVPYHVSGGTSFFSRGEIKDAMAYLRLMINPSDDNAFFRIANVPRRKLGTATIDSLSQYARANGLSMLAACATIPTAAVSESSRKHLRAFHQWISSLAEQASTEAPDYVIRQLFKDIDYRGWLLETSSSEQAGEQRWNNVEFLLDSLARSLHLGEDESIEEAIERLVLRDLLEQQEEEEEASHGVNLMTLHSSKGLEFPYVFLIGMEENLLPHRSSIEEDNIEEERRLAYVGITRARRHLTMTLAKRRRQFGAVNDCEPSRFLAELPEDDLVHLGQDSATTPEENLSRGRDTLAGLQDLFS